MLGGDPRPQCAKIEWDDGPNAAYDSKAFREAMEATARKPGLILRSEGDFASAFSGADKKVEAEYYIPHLAHATMEPPSATARIADGKAEVWTSVQSPQAAHDLVAKVDEKGNLTVPRVDVAIDCGPTVNPDRVRSQLEGAVIMGLGLATKSEISFKNGRVQQNNFDDYQVTPH